jgi:hypothetical protein
LSFFYITYSTDEEIHVLSGPYMSKEDALFALEFLETKEDNFLIPQSGSLINKEDILIFEMSDN